MAEETKKPEPTVAVPAPTQVPVPEAEKTPATSSEKHVSASLPEAEKSVVASETTEVAAVEVPEETVVDDEKKITQSVSFKEETNVVSELPEYQRKALDELKKLITDACAKREFSAPPPPPAPVAVVEETPAPTAEVTAAVEEKVEEVAKPVEETSKKTEEVAKPVEEASKKPVEEGSKKIEEVAKPVEETSKKIEEVPKPVEESSKKIDEVVKPVEAEEKTVEAIKETIIEVSTEAEPVAVEPIPEEPIEPEEVSIWGIPLLADERSDVILLKFLRARDFKVKEAFTMIRNTVRWRKELGVDELLDQDLGDAYQKVLFTHGVDKEGRVVCYNVFGEFQDKEFYNNSFGDAEKRDKLFKWLVQFVEKIVRGLDFSPKGVNSFVLVNDLKNFPGFGKRDVSKIIDKFLVVLQDNYPEFVAKQLCINTSWWYVAYYWIYLTVFTPRSKSKFVFASPSKTPETLFKYIAPEHVPVQYGGHSKTGETEFTSADSITEVTIKPNSIYPIEFAFSEATEVIWELRVIGWDVNYGAEFVPAKEGGYTLNISKPKKVASTEEPVIVDTFKVTEAGKVVITIDNQSSKKKKLLYRSKVKA
ncbi:patellin-3-like [Silene latifolia]|uniref:patellin-3-like n=1 Tax=Silene latifolia TaxID=37657 RepID=UPI003D7729F4